MTDYYMNNPMMDIFKKAMENPASLMNMWTQNMDMTKGMDMMKNYSPANWMEYMPWMNKAQDQNSMNNPMGSAFNFADSMKNAEVFSKTC